MKIIPKEEADAYPMLGQGRYTKVHIWLLKLKPGEKLIIVKGVDWISKSTPYKVARGVAKKYGWKLIARRSPDETGWVVKREE
ncbi:MAG TPA: hypothetical protein VI757_06910 [Bacteroidia bacterium]|nr:hypothetical protein [Bacteroidia bacterium]